MTRLFFLLLICGQSGFARPDGDPQKVRYADSLLARANSIFYTNPDSSFYYSELALDYAIRHKLDIQKALAWLSQAKTEVLRGDIELALQQLKNAIVVFEKYRQQDKIAKCYGLMSTAVSKINNHRESIDFLLKASAIYRQQKNEDGLTATLVNLANVYCDIKEFDKALEALNESRLYTKPGDKQWYYYYINAGIIYMNNPIYALAKTQFDSCLFISKKNKMIDAEVTAHTKMAELLLAMKKTGEALACFDKAITMARANHLPLEESEALSGLLRQAETSGDYRKAFIYQNRLKAISDSLFNIEKIKNINTIETKLKVSEKEKTIALQRLDMQKNAADQEKSRKRIVMLVAGSSLLLLVLFFILYVFIKTKRQKKEVELQKNRAERLNILNQKIFAVIAHDFKSPMIALNMLMDLLDKENISKEDLSSYSADVRNQVIQSGQILDNLLNWAKTELKLSYDTNLKASPFLIAEEIIKELTFMSSRKNIRIINHIPPAIALKVPPDILRIILRNLLSNAVKFSYSDNAITTGYNNNIIFVADQGQGVQEKTLNELFSGTVQSKLGTFNETGFGLGLYITHELINKFQGKIWVENNNPSGTVFKFVLPVYE